MVLISESTTAPSLRRRKLVALSHMLLGICALTVAVSLFFIDIGLIVSDIALHIKPNSSVMAFMETGTETVYIQVYLFNVTNDERFLAGLDNKLKVQEVGPFTYKEFRKNEDLELNTEAGVMRYSIRNVPTFVLERSIGRPEDFNVTMPNLPMLGIASLFSSYSYFSRLSFNLLSQQLGSKPLITIDALSYLWGYEEPILKLANRLMPGLINFDRLGILERIYDKNLKHRMESSALDTDKFRVKTRNNITKLLMNERQDPESCQYCDTFEDTYEGLMFPTPVTPDSKIKLFRTGLCKLLDMEFSHMKRMDTFDALVFRLHDKFFSLNKSLVNDGMLDLSECYFGLPMTLTKLNFLDMDAKFYARIEGLKKPDPKYNTYITIDPKMGLTLDTYVPIQINLVTKDLSYHTKARPFSNLVIPIGYVIIKQVELNSNTLKSLELMYRLIPILTCVFKFVFITISIICFSYSTRLLLRLRKENKGIAYPVLNTGVKEKGVRIAVNQPLINQYEYR